VKTAGFPRVFQWPYIFGARGPADVWVSCHSRPLHRRPGFGPTTIACSDGTTFTNSAGSCPGEREQPSLSLYPARPTQAGETNDQSGFSSIANNEYALFLQDTWKVTRNLTLNYGLRWEAQQFPDPVIAPSKNSLRPVLSNPAFPSTGFFATRNKLFQPRVGFAWDIRGDGKICPPGELGHFHARQNMLTQVDQSQRMEYNNSRSVEHISRRVHSAYPNTVPNPILAPDVSRVCRCKVFSKNYANPRILRSECRLRTTAHAKHVCYARLRLGSGCAFDPIENPMVPVLGHHSCDLESDRLSIRVRTLHLPQPRRYNEHYSDARSLYRGVTFGVKEHLSQMFQMEAITHIAGLGRYSTSATLQLPLCQLLQSGGRVLHRRP